jgi:hypothetical protein
MTDDDAFKFIIDRAKKEPDLDFRYYHPPIQTNEYMRRKREFLEDAKEARDKEKPIQRYCYTIRGIKPWYEYSFEETIRSVKEDRDRHAQLLEREIDLDRKKDKKSRARLREIKKIQKEEEQREKAEKEFIEKHSPFHVLKQDLELIECYCNSSRIKKGEYCLTCTLLRSMHEYMMRSFKRASERDSDLK